VQSIGLGSDDQKIWAFLHVYLTGYYVIYGKYELNIISYKIILYADSHCLLHYRPRIDTLPAHENKYKTYESNYDSSCDIYREHYGPTVALHFLPQLGMILFIGYGVHHQVDGFMFRSVPVALGVHGLYITTCCILRDLLAASPYSKILHAVYIDEIINFSTSTGKLLSGDSLGVAAFRQLPARKAMRRSVRQLWRSPTTLV
jgi:hypothetical protein